jgi:hypothetical protein
MQNSNTLQLVVVHFTEGAHNYGDCCNCYVGISHSISDFGNRAIKGIVCVYLCFYYWIQKPAVGSGQ